MLFNVNISPSIPGAPSFNVQVEAPDLVSALEGAKAPILDAARKSQAILADAVPTTPPPAAQEAPKA